MKDGLYSVNMPYEEFNFIRKLTELFKVTNIFQDRTTRIVKRHYDNDWCNTLVVSSYLNPMVMLYIPVAPDRFTWMPFDRPCFFGHDGWGKQKE